MPNMGFVCGNKNPSPRCQWGICPTAAPAALGSGEVLVGEGEHHGQVCGSRVLIYALALYVDPRAAYEELFVPAMRKKTPDNTVLGCEKQRSSSKSNGIVNVCPPKVVELFDISERSQLTGKIKDASD